MISNAAINQAVEIIVAAATRPSSVILFGSYARGTAGEQSDIDLCVIEDTLSDKHAETVKIRRALSPLRIPVDIVVHSAESMKEWSEVKSSLIYTILREGKVLYEKK